MTSDAATVPAGAPGLFGHPRGLARLALTEAWERFSFYGMRAMLVVYMVDVALKPGAMEHVAGLTTLAAALGGGSPQAIASSLFGLYTALVYFTPVLGGALGDRWLGQRRTVLLGAMLMALGHLAMAFQPSLLAALLLLVLGGGCLKGNITAQVGALYAPDDPRRASAFSLFNAGINIGAFLGPLVCGALGEFVGWHWGFGACAAGMLVALTVYALSWRDLPPDTLRARQSTAPRPKATAAEWRVVAALLLIVLIGSFFKVPYGQESNAFFIWLRATSDRHLLGFQVPLAWFTSLDGLLCVVLTPVVVALWRRWGDEGSAAADIRKVVIGNALAVVAMGILAAGSLAAQAGATLSLGWGVGCYTVMSLGFLFSWPPTLALVSRAAPPRLAATLISVAFLGPFFANLAVGALGRSYESLGAARFWALHGAIPLAGALILLVLSPWLRRWAEPRPT